MSARFALPASVAVVALWCSACGDVSNPRIRDIPVHFDSTYADLGAVANDPIRLLIEVEEPLLVRFRAWSSGVLAGVDARLIDPNGATVRTDRSPGTTLRIDAVRLETPGVWTMEVSWLFGSGFASYRFETLSNGPSPLLHPVVGAMTTARAGHRATVLLDGTVLVTGGHAVGSGLEAGGLVPLAAAEVVDPETGEAEAVGDMVQPRAYHAAALVQSGSESLLGKVLVAGGLGPSGDALSSTELYDPVARTFSAGPFLPEPRAFLEALPVTQLGGDSFLFGKILLLGGERTRAVPQHDFYDGLYTEVDANQPGLVYFDPDVGTLQEFDQFEHARIGASYTLLPSGKVMIIGGGLDTNPSAPGCVPSETATCHCTSSTYNVCTEFTVCDAEACEYTNFTFKDLATRSVEVYDLLDGNRVTLPESSWLNRGRLDHSAAVTPGGHIVVAGGATALRRSFQARERGLPEYAQSLDSVELWDPSSETFKVLPPISIPRENQVSAALADGRVLLVGGLTPIPGGLGPVDLIELYDPVRQRFSVVDTTTSAHARPALALLPGALSVLLLGGENAGGPLADLERLVLDVATLDPNAEPEAATTAEPEPEGSE